MKKVLKRVLNTLLAGAIIVGAIYLYQYALQKAKPPTQKGHLGAVPVNVVAVGTGSVTNAIKLTGSLEATRVVDIIPKISGRLEHLAFEDGTPIWEGVAVTNHQAIAVIDHRDIKAQLQEATAAVETARTTVEAAKIVLKDRDRERGRMEKLFAEGSTTEQQRDLAVTDYEQALTRLVQTEAQLVQAEAAVEVIKVTLSEATLYAPMDGVVSAKYADPGAMVSPTTRILQVIPMEELKFLIAVPGPYLHHLHIGKTEVAVYSDAVPERTFSGLITRIHPAVDPITRTATVEVRLQNERNDYGEWLLRPGLYAEGRILINVKHNVTVFPADVALRRGERFIAFVVSDDHAQTRGLKIGIRDGNTLEVLEGLTPGEQAVVMGQHRLTDGVPVRITNVKNP